MQRCECIDRDSGRLCCTKHIPNEYYLECWCLVNYSISVRIICKSCLHLSIDFIIGEHRGYYLVLTTSHSDTDKKRMVELYSMNLKRMESGNVL